MDIHRCRFVPFPTSAINAIAFSHSSLPTTHSSTRQSTLKNVQVRLAIGRANGDIEIWNPLNGVWHQEIIIPGGNSRSVDGLVWITDADEETSDGKTILGRSRLFSIGYTAAVTEWDLEKARPKKHAGGQHGELWCIGAQPPVQGKNGLVLPSSRKLVAGTVDGNLVLYSTEDDELKFVKSLIRTPSKNTKMVSIAFQTRNIVVVGCSNSTIGVYDIRNGTLLRQMSLGASVAGGPKSIIVWSVKCLPRGDIVSGDSTGQVCIWDGRTYTQAQRLQSHTQDVLCLAVSADGSQIVSGGMDRRTVFYEPRAGHSGRWSKLFHRKYHAHDVKAMASFEGNGLSVVVSGGPDTNPVVFPLKTAGKEFHLTLPYLPQQTSIQSAPKARLVLSWWGNELRIWSLINSARKFLDGETTGADVRKNRKLVAKILVQGESNITSAAINTEGTLLIASTATDVKAFQLLSDDATGRLQIKKVDIVGASHGATKVEISPDTMWACWIEEGTNIVAARITSSASAVGPTYAMSHPRKLRRLRRGVPKHILLGGLGSYDRKVTQVAFSPDSRMLSVADLAGYIDTWVLQPAEEVQNGTAGGANDDGRSDASSSDSEDEGEVDTRGEWWRRNPKSDLLPKLEAAPVVLSFSPGHMRDDGDYTLVVITALRRVLVFNPLRGGLADWSRRNPFSKFPEPFRKARDTVKGIVWQGSRAWVYGSSSLFMLDLSQDFPESTRSKDGPKKGTKRKRDGLAGAGGQINKEHSLAPQQIKASAAPDGTEWADVEMADADDQKSNGASSAYEDDDDDTDGGELQRLRGDQAPNGDDAGKENSKPKTWHTFQYRPILGIVPLVIAPPKKSQPDKLAPIEVALVERPFWDLDLPSRYAGDGEWER